MGYFDTTTNHKPYVRCYSTHPPLPINVGGKTYNIYGGSCSTPVHNDADIYVGLDYSMKDNPKMYPWNDGDSIQFIIQDMGVPKDADEFKKLIDWVAVQLIANKKVHVGCIGGHGRTGLVFSALVKHMTGNDNATSYVRSNYCKKAVESKTQINFLEKYFNIIPVDGTKAEVSDSIYSTNKASKRYKGGSTVITGLDLLDFESSVAPDECTYRLW